MIKITYKTLLLASTMVSIPLVAVLLFQNSGYFVAIGTVQYMDLEGGFYGIITGPEDRYDPVNLASKYQVDGLRVVFVARTSENQCSFHMWGTIIEIVVITRI